MIDYYKDTVYYINCRLLTVYVTADYYLKHYQRFPYIFLVVRMNRLTRLVIEKDFPTVFNIDMIKEYFPDDNSRASLLKRAFASGDIIRLYRGWYALNQIFRKHREPLETLALANQICKKSYISLELALSFTGFIPEAVHWVTSVSDRCTKDLLVADVPFSYNRVPQRNFLAGIRQIAFGYTTHLQATPLKALADYVYVHNENWTTLHPLIHSLRIEEDDLATITASDFDEIQRNYISVNVENFLSGIRKELGV